MDDVLADLVQVHVESDLPDQLHVAAGVVLAVLGPGGGQAPVLGLGHGGHQLPARPGLEPVLGGEPGTTEH